MDRFFYASITRLRDALATGDGVVRLAAVSGPTKVTDGSIGVVGASVESVPVADNDALVIVMG